MWPTPTVNDAKNSSLPPSQVNRDSVVGAVMRLWPTPQANSWGSTGHREMLQTKVDEGVITAEEKHRMTHGNNGHLNPTWVEWLMGFPPGWTDLED